MAIKTTVTMKLTALAWTGGPKLVVIGTADADDITGAIIAEIRIGELRMTVEQARDLSASLKQASNTAEKLLARVQAEATK